MMKVKLIITFFLLLPPALFAQEKPLDFIVGIVGDEIILLSDIETQYEMQSFSFRQDGKTKEEAKCMVLEETMYQKLLLNQSKLDSIEVSAEQTDGELERRIRYMVGQMGSEKKFEEYYGKSLEEFKSDMREPIEEQLLSQMMQGKITDNIKVTPSEVKKYFEHIPKDSLPLINSEIEFAHIVKKPEVNDEEKQNVKEKLEVLQQRIRGGEDFGTLAYLYSEDPTSAKKNGELGFVQRGELVHEFEAIAFNLKKGGVSEIVETIYGYHLLQLIERRGEQINVRHILLIPKVSPKDLNEAKNSLDSIKQLILTDTLDFEEAASRFSDDKDSKNNGGKVVNPQAGTTSFATNQLDPVTFFHIDKMKVGEILEPVLYNSPDAKQAYRIIKLLKRTEPHLANLKDDYRQIQNAALAEKQEKAINDWIKKKKESTYFKINDDYRNCNFARSWFN